MPVEIRKKLGMKTGDVLKVKITDEGTVVLTGKVGVGNNPNKAIEILRETAGIWKDMEESGEEFVRRLRNEDCERLKVLELD